MRLSHVVASCLALVLAFGIAAGLVAAANSAPPNGAPQPPVVTPPAPRVAPRAQPVSPAWHPNTNLPPFPNLANGGAPAFGPAGNQSSGDLMVATLPMPSSASLAICLDAARVWGVGNPGQVVTVTVGGTQVGAAAADGKGFFWSTLYNPSTGSQPSLNAGAVVAFYPAGASATSITLRNITGQVYPATNIVSGTVTGVSAPISVTVYVASGEPTTVAYSKTVNSNASGYFVADFTGRYDLLSDDTAIVAYVLNGVEVHRHVYPANSLYIDPAWQEAGGFAGPGSVVTLTVSSGGTPVETDKPKAGAKGDYYTQFTNPLVEGEVVHVTYSDGTVISRTVDRLTELIDVAHDRITGQAKPGATVVGSASRLTSQGWQTTHLATTADAGGAYTLTYTGLGDVLPDNWYGVYAPDSQGNDLVVWQPTPQSITVNQTWTGVYGVGAIAPPIVGDQPVTLTVHSAALGLDRTFYQNLSRWGGYSFGQNLPWLAPGDVITVANGAWQGSLKLTTLNVGANLALDQVTGSIVSPTAQVEVDANQWGSGQYPLAGSTASGVTAGPTGYFTATLAGFDVRPGVHYEIAHRNAAGYTERVGREPDWVEVAVQYNGLNAMLYPPGTAYTITLSNSGGAQKAQLIGQTSLQAGDTGWRDFWNTGKQIAIGDQVKVQGANGFNQTVVIPSLVITPVVGAAGVVTGQGPANTRLYVDAGNHGSGFVSTDKSGRFAVALSQLQSFSGDSNLQWGDNVRVTYFDLNNNRVAYIMAAPDVGVQSQTTSGNARPGGVYVYQMQYSNNSNAAAANTVITDTLPPNTTYAGDTSGFVPTIAGGVITWNLGTLAAGTQVNFMLTLNVLPTMPSGGDNLQPNCAGIITATPGDNNSGNNWSCSAAVFVESSGPDTVDVGVNKWANPNDPAPGQLFQYTLNGCNQRSTAAGPVWLTDTLPASTSFVSWAPSDTSNPMWTAVTTVGPKLVFKAPGLPGNNCNQINVTLRLDPAAGPINSVLQNTVDIATAGDADASNNEQINTDARISRSRSDVAVNKWINGGQLTAGGYVNYGVGYSNQGNAAAHIRITDTLPAGATYQLGSIWSQNQLLGGPTIVGNQLVWDLGVLDINQNSNFSFQVSLGALAPNTVITNSVQAGLVGAVEETPWDNTASVTHTIRASGVNLGVQLNHDDWQWRNNHNLNYQVGFQNLGDIGADSVWITDTWPISTSLGGCNLNGWDNRVIHSNNTGTAYAWEIDHLNPGESGGFSCWVNLDDPNANPAWYTSTVAMDTPPGDTNPADNQASDTAVNAEVGRVELNVGTDQSNMWGEAQPNAWVTVTTAYTQVVVQASGGGCDAGGCWNLGDNNVNAGPVQPGDVVTVTSGQGLLPVIIHVPSPFSGAADSRTGQVTGQIGSLDHAVVEVQLDNQNRTKQVQTDLSGHYTAVLPDFPRGGQGEVRYHTSADKADITFHGRFASPDLILTVAYMDNWVETHYEPGHTMWITVTNSAGVTKATQTGVTGVVPWWNAGDTGYSTNIGSWLPGQPNIVPGDYVYGALDNGYTTSVRVGTLNGALNTVAGSLTVTATVPWESTPLTGHAWVENAPNGTPDCWFNISPNNGAYTCHFPPADLTPFSQVSAAYQGSDGNWVRRRSFQAPMSRLNIQTWANGQPGAGGDFALIVQYDNQGDTPAANTVITSTLEGVTYLSNSGGFGNSGSSSVAVLNLGTVPANSSNQFEIYAHVTASASQNITNTVRIGTSTLDSTDSVSKEAQWSGTVQPYSADINVGTSTWTWEPSPGNDYVYSPNVCNGGSTGSTLVTLTNTLPLSTTLVSWWGQNPGWTQVVSAPHQLVVSRPTLTGGQCEQVYVRVHLSPAAVVGDDLYYQADVFATNDTNLTNNESDFTHKVSLPYYDLYLNKNWNWGRLVPGGEVDYGIHYGNNGNLPVSNAQVTDMLPPNTTFLGAWYYDALGQHPVTPTTVSASSVVFQAQSMDPGYGGRDFEIALQLNPGVTPGTVFTNCAAISAGVTENNNPYDNQQCVTDTVRAAGPNLRVTQYPDWQNPNRMHYRIRLENIGTEIIDSVTITDTYPASFTLSGWDLNRGRSGFNNDSGNHQFVITLDSPFYPGDANDLNLYFDVPTVLNGTHFTNTAEITTPPGDVNPADNVATQDAGTGPDVGILKSLPGGATTASKGQLLTYTLHFSNQSSQWPSNPTLITDTLPAGLEFVSGQQRLCGSGHFFCNMPPGQDQPGILTWNIPYLGTNNWNDYLVTVRVTDTVHAGDQLVNQAQISPNGDTDPYLSNNTSTYTVTIRNNYLVYLPLLKRP